jgi:hypothetical protein
MPTLTKIDHMRGVKSAELLPVLSIGAKSSVTSELTLEEARALRDSLDKQIEKIEAATQKQADSPQKRLANVQAAASSKDPKKLQAFTLAVNSLRKLGFEIDAICASGSTKELEDQMKKYSWDTTRRMVLKSQLAQIGAIA